jgi:murein L,D-transpeptidase YcbB/YkuD
VPTQWRVRQIELALERLRWLPHLGDQRLLVVNIPMFQLWAWDRTPPRTTPQFSMNVVVGRALGAQTPVLAALMREVIFRPYWNVPRSIVVREILPALSRDPGYLERHDMEIVRGDGDRAVVERTGDATNGLRRGTLQVRQRPGPQNSLGLIKFEFPNAESIYMHGTPAHALFGRPRRDFSHGCIRVEDPVRLAQWVLNDDVRWNRERIVGATMDSSSMRVAVPQPIQVILFYTTAAVMPDDGSVHFASDIYGQDAGLDRAVARRVVSE